MLVPRGYKKRVPPADSVTRSGEGCKRPPLDLGAFFR
jgi:hypothetical protein